MNVINERDLHKLPQPDLNTTGTERMFFYFKKISLNKTGVGSMV